MKVEWSADALADLSRFAVFLHDRFPSLAAVVGRELIAKSRILAERPLLGHPIGASGQYRQVVLQVLNAAYVFQYIVDGDRVVILRVFHGRETRE